MAHPPWRACEEDPVSTSNAPFASVIRVPLWALGITMPVAIRTPATTDCFIKAPIAACISGLGALVSGLIGMYCVRKRIADSLLNVELDGTVLIPRQYGTV